LFLETSNRNFFELRLNKALLTSDPVLVQVVRELGKRANSRYSDLKIVEIPADVEWQINEYDGVEWVAEKHRTWD
jgi:hypothetical protein